MFVDHSRQLSKINNIVHATLAQPLQSHCKVANYRENVLYLHVDSPAWATRLRFAIPELITELKKNNDISTLKEIRIHQGDPGVSIPKTKTDAPPKRGLSKDTAEQLNCLADNVTDQELATALRRLAQRAR